VTTRDLDWARILDQEVREVVLGAPVLRPTTEQAVADCLLFGQQHGLKLRAVSGLRTPRPARAQEARVDAWISLEALRGLVDWHPHEGTVTARAGTPLAEVEAIAESAGWRVLPQVPDPLHTTVGGMISAGISGLERLRRGPLRHHVLGVRLALPNGSVVRSGSRLVKNVTGYDVHRAATGARGELGVVVEASLRLVPLPRAAFRLSWNSSSWTAVDAAAQALLSTSVEFDCVRSTRMPDGWTLVGWYSGRPETCAVMEQEALRAVPQMQSSGVDTWDGGPLAAAWKDTRASEAAVEGCLELGCLRTECATQVEQLLKSQADVRLVDHGLARIVLRDSLHPQKPMHPPSVAAGSVQAQLELRLRRALDPHGVLARSPAS